MRRLRTDVGEASGPTRRQALGLALATVLMADGLGVLRWLWYRAATGAPWPDAMTVLSAAAVMVALNVAAVAIFWGLVFRSSRRRREGRNAGPV